MRVLGCFLLTLSCFGANSGGTRVLAFERRNAGYVAHGGGYALSVTSRATVLRVDGHDVRLSAAGARPDSTLEGLDRMAGKANYLLGRDVRASYDLYGRVRWRGVYSGIDVVFRGNQDCLEYDFEIAAKRDPRRIRLAFEGMDEMRIDERGDLILRAGTVRILQPRPVAWQVIGGKKQPVEVAYRIDESKHVRFRTGAYDRGHALVIDPQIIFNKVFGGSAQSFATGLARDTQGGLYVTGMTSSPDFGTVNPVQGHLGTAPLVVTADAGQTWTFPSLGAANNVTAIAAAPSAPLTLYAATPSGIFKSADGGTSWAATTSTGLAGAPATLAVDASSATTVYTATAQGVFVSTDGGANWQASTNGIAGTSIPAIAAHPSQAGTVFAAFQNPAALFRSTDSGQSWTQLTLGPGNQVVPFAIVFDQDGTIIVGTPMGLLISRDGGNTWASGASQGTYNRQALAISPGNPGILYLASLSGLHRSTDGGQTFNPVSPSVPVTQFGRVAVDPRNPAIVYAADYNFLVRSIDGGQTWSQLSLPYPISPEALFVSPADSRVFVGAFTQNNAFVTKWSADGSQVLYSTYLGGSSRDGANAIAVDGTGSAYITGYTTSPDFPTTSGAFQTKLNSRQDVFVAKLSPDGSKLVYSTLLGAASASVSSIAADATGNAVITGQTLAGFPVTPNAFQTTPAATCNVQIPFATYTPLMDAFVTKIAAGGNALVYSTLLGGSCATFGTNVALDGGGNAWVTGTTISTDFPVTPDALQPKLGGGYYDGFLARFSPSGGRDYATYVGGAGYDALNAIAFDPAGNIYLAGQSGGLSQPASAGAFQPQANARCPAFNIGPAVYSLEGNGLVLKLDPAGHSIERLTYLGAPYCLSPSSIAVGPTGEPWIAGTFNSASAPPTVNPLFAAGQGFISKFSADFKHLLFSTYFDSVSGLALDNAGFAYVAGTSGFSATPGVQPVYVAKIDSTPPPISLDAIVNVVPAVSPRTFQGITAAQVIRILGRNMGPASATPGVIVAGVLASSVGGVQVTFDGVAAPLLSVSAQEIDLVTPFDLGAKTATTLQVQYNGLKSNAVQVAVRQAELQILGVFNQDFSVNSASNPAQAGSVMILYVAGAGQTSPPSRDGQVNAAPFAPPAVPIRVEWIVNNPNYRTVLPVAFAGAAPGLAAGIFQVNFVAPQENLTPLHVLVGTSSAQFSVFVRP